MEEKYINPQEEDIILLDESGNEVHFDHLLTFFHEGEKYIALMPVDDVENVDEGEVILLHIVSKDGEDVYETIDNEVLLEEAFETFLELFEEIIEQED